MLRILIADDSRTSRKILRSMLEELRFEVVGEAVNGEEACSLYRELKPDIVTLDITMPVLDGISALKNIKNEFPESKIIMITAAGQRSKVLEATRLGANEFILKPFDANTLLTALEKVLH